MEITMELLYEATQNEGNYIGKGSFAKVYNIPSMDGYVLRVERNVVESDFFKYPVADVQDEFPGYNFGQKNADNNHGITILKKVKGCYLGFANPPEKDDPKKFLPEHAEQVLAQIKGNFGVSARELRKPCEEVAGNQPLQQEFFHYTNILFKSKSNSFVVSAFSYSQ